MGVAGAGFAQDGAGLFDLLAFCGEEAALHTVRDLLEGGDLSGEGGNDEFGGGRGLGCFAVGAQFVDVLFDRRKVGGVGAVEAAAGALKSGWGRSSLRL